MSGNREPVDADTRLTRMRRRLGTLTTVAAVACLMVGLTAGCGSSSSTATDPGKGPASDPAGLPSWSPGPIPDASTVTLISQTAAGGTVGRTAMPLNSEADIARFSAQFRLPAIRVRIQRAIGDELKVPDHDLVGQVVAVGCDVPPKVDIVADAAGRVLLVPHEVASPLEECLAPVTTIGIAALPRN